MARPRSGKVPRNAIKHLTARHKEMARRLVLGERQCDVAKAFNISQPRMSDIERSPVFIAYMDALAHRRETATGDILSQVQAGARNGLAMLLKVLTDGTPENKKSSPSIKVKVAQDLLDREGSVPIVRGNQIKKVSLGGCLTSDDIAKLKRLKTMSSPSNSS